MGQDVLSSTSPLMHGRRFLTADGTVSTVIVPTSQFNKRIDQLFITSFDSALRYMKLSINDGSDEFVLGAFDIPSMIGFSGTIPVNPIHLLFPLLTDGIPLLAGQTLNGTMVAAVTAATSIDVVAWGGYI